MIHPRFAHVQCLSPAGMHRMAYTEWGDPANPRVLICVHGLTRVGRDFDTLARALCDRYRVICPDVVGRGRSDFLRDPRHYDIPQYVADMVTLIARANVEEVAWLGTSMGGLIGIALAGQPESPVSKLIVNDVGPRLDALALMRIGEYLGKPMVFANIDEATNYIAAVSLPFGLRTREEWRSITETVVKPTSDGKLTLHYDLNVAVPFRASTPQSMAAGEAALWSLYDRIACPTLLVRGEHSDLLTIETAREMTLRGPRVQLVEVKGVGHAPMFMHDDQIEIVKNFLFSNQEKTQ